MKVAGKQIVSGLVLESRRTRNDNGAMVTVQIMGAAPETCYVSDEEGLPLAVGDTVDCSLRYRPHGTDEIVKTGKDNVKRTDRFTTFRQFVDIIDKSKSALPKAA